MYTRLVATRLKHLAQQFPAVLILGARQVGKTTLARQTFADFTYLDLEDPGTYGLFAEDPRFQLDARSNADGLILDEAQRMPVILPLFSVLLKPPIMRTSCLAAGPLSSVAQTSSG